MAEVAGLAFGIVPLVIQITTHVDKLNEIRNSARGAPEELSSLLEDLNFINHCISCALQHATECDEYALNYCKKLYSQLVKDLEVLNAKLQDEGRSRRNLIKIMGFRHWKEDAKRLRDSAQVVKENLTLLISLPRRPFSGQSESAVRFLESSTQVVEEEEIELDAQHTDNNTMQDSATPPPDISLYRQNVRRAPLVSQRAMTRLRDNCTSKFCSCICHRTVAISSRFWAFEYFPLAAFLRKCDTNTCNTAKFGFDFRIALTRLGIKRAVVAHYCILSASGGFSHDGWLKPELVVPYTSPGFEIIWKTKTHQMTIQKAQEELTQLFRTDPRAFRDHVNPSGVSYIEYLVEPPAKVGTVDDMLDLFKLFVGEFKMTRGIEHPRFLTKCAKWIGEGPHLYLLECLLSFGIEMPELDGNKWPPPCSPGWVSESHTPDPFFLDYLHMLCESNQGFAGMTPLHEAIFAGDFDSFNPWLTRALPNERNILGQTPMHLAVSRPRFLDALIEGGHDVDAVDNHGITPLMYAAATNQRIALGKLIKSGADLSIKCSLNNRNFFDYAIARGNWKLILNSLEDVAPAVGSEFVEQAAEIITARFLLDCGVSANESVDANDGFFHQLLAKCGSVNLVFDDPIQGVNNNCLMHAVYSNQQVDDLLRCGFTLMNHQNSDGQHPLITAAQRIGPGITQRIRSLLDAVAKVNLKDKWNHTALYYSFTDLQGNLNGYVDIHMQKLRIFLLRGADTLSADNCRCACSPGGCLTTAALAHRIPTSGWGRGAKVPVWSLEVLHVLAELCGEGEAKIVLLSFIRKSIFDEHGMTHVCCQREKDFAFFWRFGRYTEPFPEEDVSEILDEESEFINMLEESMNQHAGKSFDELLVVWMRLIKKSLDIEITKAHDHSKGLEDRGEECRDSFEVDRKKDIFIRHVVMPEYTKHPLLDAAQSVAEYLTWLKRQRLSEDIPYLKESNREEWYIRRHHWALELIKQLELPVTPEIEDQPTLPTYQIATAPKLDT